MKLIQQSKLFFKEGNSDKVYEIDLCEISPDEYIVNFRYGRRGGSMKEGTKTPAAVSRDKADMLFAELENEKRKKGYQTEIETFIELPSLAAIEPGSVNGIILQRLQDAVEGKSSFKTEWKTSRVIWKAGVLQMQEAIPFILKLASKGDVFQMYSGLWALTQLKAVQAAPLFKTYAYQLKQKQYLRNMAFEGLLTISEGDDLKQYTRDLLDKLPYEIRSDIEASDYTSLGKNLLEHSRQRYVSYFSDLYLLCKVRPDILSSLNQAIATWEFKPPYFKHVRAIYKLAQTRKDFHTLSLLSYRFEKESAMFRRTVALDSDYRQYISSVDQMVRIGQELRSKDSKIGFSNFTKNYFQRNAVEFLKNAGKTSDAKEYLRLAVSTLLQYTEADYSKAGERPQTEYGIYDYKKKVYQYVLNNYPECADSLLLTTILYGNDAQRKLQPNLKFIIGQRTVTSNSYYYNPNNIISEVASTSNMQSQPKASHSEPASIIGSAINTFKGIFGKKTSESDGYQKEERTETPPLYVEQPKEEIVKTDRLELYPEHWDALPQAYVQLLMQARMNIIHQFAYNNLKKRNDLASIANYLDAKAILQLLNSSFLLPNQFGYEVLLDRKEEFCSNPNFIGQVLNTNSVQAREWAKALVVNAPEIFMDDLEFVILLISNTKKENNAWINELLQNTKFTDSRLQVVLGKLITELLQLQNTGENNELAKTIVKRINVIGAQKLEYISWNIVEQLILSPLETNILLASSILISKSKKVNPADIPTSLVELFLKNDIQEVRQNGIQLLNQYPQDFLVGNFNFVLNQVNNAHKDVVEEVLKCIRSLILSNTSLGNSTIHHIVYALIRKENYEGAHALINQFVFDDLEPYWNSGLSPKDLTKLIHAQYRQSQVTGYEILKGYNRSNEFSIGQIISFGNHEILALRQWCWSYFKENVARIRYEKDKSLGLLDSKWDDTRAYAFHFFKAEFTESDWDCDTLIGIVDSIRPDVEAFGKELITRYSNSTNALEYLTKLSQHPSINVQAFVTGYLTAYAANNTNVIKELDFYFRSVLTRVNKARVAKDRVFNFLHQEAIRNQEAANQIVSILDDISAQSTIQDKATCIHILTEIKNKYSHLDMYLTIKN